jgi:hypothetical protein
MCTMTLNTYAVEKLTKMIYKFSIDLEENNFLLNMETKEWFERAMDGLCNSIPTKLTNLEVCGAVIDQQNAIVIICEAFDTL